jgi:hypothetical protein
MRRPSTADGTSRSQRCCAAHKPRLAFSQDRAVARTAGTKVKTDTGGVRPRLAKGIEYNLRSITRTSDRLIFHVAVGETWNRMCQEENEACPGSPGGCEEGDESPVLRICACEDGLCTGAKHALFRFDLAITSDTIEGELPFGGDLGTVAEIRLQRAR